MKECNILYIKYRFLFGLSKERPILDHHPKAYIHEIRRISCGFQSKDPLARNSNSMFSFLFFSFLFFFFFFENVLRWQVSILWSHWNSLFLTSVDSAHGFQSQGGPIMACALLSLARILNSILLFFSVTTNSVV